MHLNAWWLVPAEAGPARAVIVCHGVADSSFGALGFALLFVRNGYAVLVPDSRGHGESGGAVTYGVEESDDILRWLGWMKAHGVRTAFGFGESLGGAILIQSLARGTPFRAVVAESAYSSFERVADDRISQLVPSLLAHLLVREGMLYAYARYGVNLWRARTDDAISAARVPVLLIHGKSDFETGVHHSETLRQRSPGFAQLWLVPGARHTGAYAAAPQQFEMKVLEWFR